jgi:3-phosphoshikimate 1-carboxyvinyltransferase
MIVEGGRGIAGGNARSFGDHRLAMALAVAGVAGAGTVGIEDAECVSVSYPEFWDHLEAISR